MTDEFDDFARSLQSQIYEETRKAYGQVAFERWRKPLYVGVMHSPEGYGRIKGTCGDTMEIFLRIDGSRIGVAGLGGLGSQVAIAEHQHAGQQGRG